MTAIFCPKCHAEYREGYTVCAQCDIALVNEVPVEESNAAPIEPEVSGSGDWVTVLEGADTSELMVARSLLDSAEIPFTVQGERLQELIEPGRLGVNFSIPVGPVKLQVQTEDLEEAREILTVKGDEPEPESSVEELEHKLKSEVKWFAGFGLAGLVVSYAVVPGYWEQPVRVLIYIVTAFCAALFGSHVRKSRESELTAENVVSSEGEEFAPASGNKRKYLFVAIFLAIAMFAWYYHGVDKGAEGNLSEGEIRQSLRGYKKAIDQNPDYAPDYFSAGTAYLMLKSPQEALPYFDKAIQLDPKYTDCLFNRGMAHHQLGDYEQAIEDFSRIIEFEPRYRRIADTYYGRAAAYYSDQKYSRAMDDYDKVIDLEPGRADAYVYRGQSYEKFTNDHKRAISYYDKALEVDPKNGPAYTERGYARAELGQYADALKDYEMGIQLNPKEAEPYNGIAWFLATCREGRYRDGKKAVRNARKALQLAENGVYTGLPDIYETLAAAYAESGDFDEAVKVQSKAYSLYKPRHVNDSFQNELRQLLEAYKDKQTYAQWKSGNPGPG